MGNFFNDVADVLTAQYEAVKAGRDIDPKKLDELGSDLRKWAGRAFDERSRIDKLVAERTGAAGGVPAIDFAEARASIGRRLDRLRAACAAGSVSGRTDGA
jgi:hypothetical protein